MDLYQEIIAHVIERGKIQIEFPHLKISAKEIVEMECYKALKQIKEIIEDERLEDDECFEKIEAIVCCLEGIGSNGGFRHDF